MPCPCAAGGGVAVPRHPMTMKALNGNAPLSREDIRKGRVRRVPEEVDAKEEDVDVVVMRKPRRKRPMSGFLSDAMLRKR